jgi:hypothetical protein
VRKERGPRRVYKLNKILLTIREMNSTIEEEAEEERILQLRI